MAGPTMLDAALDYATRGWPVLPLWWVRADGTCGCGHACGQDGKHPMGRLVPHGLKDATTDTTTVRRWWAQAPHANIGLRTGVAFDVLDIDDADIAEVVASWGLHVAIPDGPVVRTGKGWHFYVQPTGHANRTAMLPSTDWRGAEGYVVAPPSTHRSGRRYEWHTSHDTRMPTAHDALLRVLGRAVTPGTPTGTRPVGVVDARRILLSHPNLSAFVPPPGRLRFDGLVRRVANAPHGQRNHLLWWCATRVLEHHAAGQITARDVDAVLHELHDAALRAGLDGHEAGKTIAGARRRTLGGAA